MANSLDFVSTCPSLIDVLCLLDYSSILKCKLVNRCFHDVIKNNWRNRNLPRPRINLYAESYTETPRNPPYMVVHLSVRARVSIYIITEFCICFWSKCEKKPISRHYAENGIPFVTTSSSYEEYALNVIGQSMRRYKRESSLIYKTRNFDDGFRQFFSVLLRHYYLEGLTADPDLFNWTIFLETFVACRSRCERLQELHITAPWPAFKDVHTQLGCPDVQIELHTPLVNVISDISSWRCKLEFWSNVENVEMILPIVQLMQSWITGMFRIKYLSAFAYCYEYPQWSFEMLFDFFRTTNIQPFYQKIIKNSRENDRKKHIVMLFRRNHDELTLCFACCPERKEMIVYDCIYKGNPDDLQCNYPQYFGS